MVRFLLRSLFQLVKCVFLMVCQKESRRKLSHDFYKGTNPVREGATLMSSSNSNHLPKSPPPNTIILGVGFHHMNLGGDTNIQFITYFFSQYSRSLIRVKCYPTLETTDNKVQTYNMM